MGQRCIEGIPDEPPSAIRRGLSGSAAYRSRRRPTKTGRMTVLRRNKGKPLAYLSSTLRRKSERWFRLDTDSSPASSPQRLRYRRQRIRKPPCDFRRWHRHLEMTRAGCGVAFNPGVPSLDKFGTLTQAISDETAGPVPPSRCSRDNRALSAEDFDGRNTCH